MIGLKHISHHYADEAILHDISLEIASKSFNIISGESGSGKSTLLSIISTLLTPSKGQLFFEKKQSTKIANMDRFRNKHIGFVFQFHYLISHLTVYENIALVSHKSKKDAYEVLEKLGILELANKYPDEISGGQRQRAAIARAIINKPRYIFADEPTGSLDSKNSQIVFDILRELDATVVVATHELAYVQKSDRIIKLKDGRLC